MFILPCLHILVLYPKTNLVAFCLISIHAKKSAGDDRDGGPWLVLGHRRL